MVKYDIDALLHHKVRVKTFDGRIIEGEACSFDSAIETGRNSEEMGLRQEGRRVIECVDEDECETLEILD